MKLQPDKSEAQTVTGYGPGWIAVNGEKYNSSMVLSSRGAQFEWKCASFEDLCAAHFDQLADLKCELIIFGSGAKIRFPTPSWLGQLMSCRIGIETMDTQAACRTYNILAAEGRHVVLAVLL